MLKIVNTSTNKVACRDFRDAFKYSTHDITVMLAAGYKFYLCLDGKKDKCLTRRELMALAKS